MVINISDEERRKIPRYLCSDEFSDSLLVYENDSSFKMMSINFNRFGIAIYSHVRLPEMKDCRLSFELTGQDTLIKITNLSCRIVNSQETEVGNRYGIKFSFDQTSELNLYQELVSIEVFLKNKFSQENRYGLL